MSKIILIEIGRNNVSKIIEIKNPTIKGKPEKEENDLAEIARKKVCKYLASSEVSLIPDEKKGLGYWRVVVGGFRHVGDIKISL